MKANELMIGDFLRYKQDFPFAHLQGKIVKVCGIDGRVDVRTINDGKFHESEHPNWLEPIPLTPEILEKNGWYRAKFDGGYGRKGIRLDGPYNELNKLPEGVENALSFAQWSIDEHFEYHLLDIYMWNGSVHLWIEYVHELQHALRLCGIEKEITI